MKDKRGHKRRETLCEIIRIEKYPLTCSIQRMELKKELSYPIRKGDLRVYKRIGKVRRLDTSDQSRVPNSLLIVKVDDLR